jgi:hypothetical protein
MAARGAARRVWAEAEHSDDGQLQHMRWPRAAHTHTHGVQHRSPATWMIARGCKSAAHLSTV